MVRAQKVMEWFMSGWLKVGSEWWVVRQDYGAGTTWSLTEVKKQKTIKKPPVGGFLFLIINNYHCWNMLDHLVWLGVMLITGISLW